MTLESILVLTFVKVIYKFGLNQVNINYRNVLLKNI